MSRILVIDDNETMRSGVMLALDRIGHKTAGAVSGPEGLALLAKSRFDLVVTDYKMSVMDGLDVVRGVKEADPDLDVIVMTAYGTIDLAVDAMKLGAADFVTKPFAPDVIQVKVEKALENRKLRAANIRLSDENRYLREEIGGQFNFGDMIGTCTEMQAVFQMVGKAAPTDSAVLIYGESGTGKELVARAIHQKSPRRDGPFVRVNCGALPKDLVESELFGHEKGAFTGAVRRKRGRFELADGGTVFLDEIGDLPPDAQVKLLRVLQEKEFEPVGSEQTLSANVRVVAATNQPLKTMVANGAFREDLFYRLEVIPIVLPPLRARKGDVPALVEHFLHKKSSELGRAPKCVTEQALAALVQYTWPGNVRELENVIERTLVLSDGEAIDLSDLPFGERSELALSEAPGAGTMSLTKRLDALERDLIEKALAEAKGVKTRAADILGIKTSALYYKLDKYGLGDSP